MEKEKIQFIEGIISSISKVTPTMSYVVREFIACQFALESDFGSSRLAIRCGNLCGMRYPRVRLTTAYSFNSKGFAVYHTFDDCIIDYLFALQYYRPSRKELVELDLFKDFISKWYCPDEDYINKITNLLNQYQNGKGNE